MLKIIILTRLALLIVTLVSPFGGGVWHRRVANVRITGSPTVGETAYGTVSFDVLSGLPRSPVAGWLRALTNPGVGLNF